jgi:hypothetical protein
MRVQTKIDMMIDFIVLFLFLSFCFIHVTSERKNDFYIEQLTKSVQIQHNSTDYLK